MASLVEMFLDELAAEKGLAANSLSAYEADITQFLDSQNISPKDISSENISAFVRYLSNKAYSIKTINRKISTIKGFCKFLTEEKLISADLLFDITRPKKESPLPKFLSPKQIEQLYQTSHKSEKPAYKRIATIIKLMFASGLRVSEVLSLSFSAINLNKNQILVKGKGAKERIVFFDDETKNILQSYMVQTRPFFLKKNPKTNFLFPSDLSNEGCLTRDAFFKSLKKLACRCGISPRLISPHTLRHSFATNLINHDVDLRSVQKMLGHENISTTEIYTHITNQRIIDSVLKKHPLKNFSNEELKDEG